MLFYADGIKRMNIMSHLSPWSRVLHEKLIVVVYVDGVRLCLLPAATNGPVLHIPGEKWVLIAMVE
jgi:hypothetical protein